jgi:lipopolysaccharide/colanic/teichoic acid biosynthesis glycosyltransferase
VSTLSTAGALAKRSFDLLASGAGLLVLSPVLLGVGLAVRLTSPGPALYRQERVGRRGHPFPLLKFRSMRLGADQTGPLVTGEGDPRITRLGRWLRGRKLDELPQLWNVFRGDMSLVGPRPEVARYVSHYTEQQRRALEVRPGITDPATLEYRDEELLLGAVEPAAREDHYIREVMPRKLQLNLRYLARAGFWSDLGVLARTLKALTPGGARPDPRKPGRDGGSG